jgi:hypothetical protein
LHFVDDDQGVGVRSQIKLRVAHKIGWDLQIEVDHGLIPSRSDRLGQGGFAGLAGTDQADDGKIRQGSFDAGLE